MNDAISGPYGVNAGSRNNNLQVITAPSEHADITNAFQPSDQTREMAFAPDERDKDVPRADSVMSMTLPAEGIAAEGHKLQASSRSSSESDDEEDEDGDEFDHIAFLQRFLIIACVFATSLAWATFGVEVQVFDIPDQRTAVGKMIGATMGPTSVLLATIFLPTRWLVVRRHYYTLITIVVILMSAALHVASRVRATQTGSRFTSPAHIFTMLTFCAAVNTWFGLKLWRIYINLLVCLGPLILQPVFAAFVWEESWDYDARHTDAVMFWCRYTFEVVVLAYVICTNVSHGAGMIEEIQKERDLREHLTSQAGKAQALLETAVPPPIARALISGTPAHELTRSFPSASIAFIVLTDFEDMVTSLPHHELLRWLDDAFGTFDRLIDLYDESIMKIETVMGSYVVAALPGMSADIADHAVMLAQFCADVLELCGNINGQRVNVQIGINAGPVTAGVIGRTRQFYRLFGDTMNVASRMMSTGEVNRIHASKTVARALLTIGVELHGITVDYRGQTFVKGKGDMSTFWLQRMASEHMPEQAAIERGLRLEVIARENHDVHDLSGSTVLNMMLRQPKPQPKAGEGTARSATTPTRSNHNLPALHVAIDVPVDGSAASSPTRRPGSRRHSDLGLSIMSPTKRAVLLAKSQGGAGPSMFAELVTGRSAQTARESGSGIFNKAIEPRVSRPSESALPRENISPAMDSELPRPYSRGNQAHAAGATVVSQAGPSTYQLKRLLKEVHTSNRVRLHNHVSEAPGSSRANVDSVHGDKAVIRVMSGATLVGQTPTPQHPFSTSEPDSARARAVRLNGGVVRVLQMDLSKVPEGTESHGADLNTTPALLAAAMSPRAVGGLKGRNQLAVKYLKRVASGAVRRLSGSEEVGGLAQKAVLEEKAWQIGLQKIKKAAAAHTTDAAEKRRSFAAAKKGAPSPARLASPGPGDPSSGGFSPAKSHRTLFKTKSRLSINIPGRVGDEASHERQSAVEMTVAEETGQHLEDRLFDLLMELQQFQVLSPLQRSQMMQYANSLGTIRTLVTQEPITAFRELTRGLQTRKSFIDLKQVLAASNQDSDGNSTPAASPAAESSPDVAVGTPGPTSGQQNRPQAWEFKPKTLRGSGVSMRALGAAVAEEEPAGSKSSLAKNKRWSLASTRNLVSTRNVSSNASTRNLSVPRTSVAARGRALANAAGGQAFAFDENAEVTSPISPNRKTNPSTTHPNVSTRMLPISNIRSADKAHTPKLKRLPSVWRTELQLSFEDDVTTTRTARKKHRSKRGYGCFREFCRKSDGNNDGSEKRCSCCCTRGAKISPTTSQHPDNISDSASSFASRYSRWLPSFLCCVPLSARSEPSEEGSSFLRCCLPLSVEFGDAETHQVTKEAVWNAALATIKLLGVYFAATFLPACAVGVFAGAAQSEDHFFTAAMRLGLAILCLIAWFLVSRCQFITRAVSYTVYITSVMCGILYVLLHSRELLPAEGDDAGESSHDVELWAFFPLIVVIQLPVFLRMPTRATLTLQLITFVVSLVVLLSSVWNSARLAMLHGTLFTLFGTVIGVIGTFFRESSEKSFVVALKAAQAAEADANLVLRNLLPSQVVEPIMQGKEVLSQVHSSCAILFADLAGFTRMASTMDPNRLMVVLNTLYCRFDDMVEKRKLWKAETIGDAYIAVAGLFENESAHTTLDWKNSQSLSNARTRLDKIFDVALEMQKELNSFRDEVKLEIHMRIGVHIGDVVTGIVGSHRPRFGVFGIPVLIAEEFEGLAETDTLFCSGLAQQAYLASMYSFVPRTLPDDITQRLAELHANQSMHVKGADGSSKVVVKNPPFEGVGFKVARQDMA